MVSSVRTTPQVFSVPTAGGEPRQLTQSRGVMSPPTVAVDGQTVAFTFGNVQQPNDVYVARLGPSIDPRRLTNHNPDLGQIALGRSETVRWKSKDGIEVEGVLVYPVGYDPAKR